MALFADILAWINGFMNALCGPLLAFIAHLPGWLSNTIIAALVAAPLLLIYKYTSNQSAIGRVRDHIKANMLALKLFKDSFAVTMQSQGQIFKGAFLLLFHAIVPMLVMIIPVSLLLAQMGLWYQFRPLVPGEETIVTLRLNSPADSPWPGATLAIDAGAEVTLGPVRVNKPQQEIWWKIRATADQGQHPMTFHINDQPFEKSLTVGEGFMRLSPRRPDRHAGDVLLYPAEKPFDADSIVQAISIDYPERISKTSGADWWILYFFIVSLIVALLIKPAFNVRI